MDNPSTNANRLRSHCLSHRATKPPRRTQRDIVRDYRDDIITLIRDDGATLEEVVQAIEAEGEAVLAAGLKAQILAQIGTVKAIRAGRSFAGQPHAQQTIGTVAARSTPSIIRDDDDDFAARPSRA